MEEDDLSFRLFINYEGSFKTLFGWFMSNKWPDLNLEELPSVHNRTAYIKQNLISFETNDEWDHTRINEKDGWFFYPFIISSWYQKYPPENSDIDEQIRFVKLLKSKLEEIGCTVKVISESRYLSDL